MHNLVNSVAASEQDFLNMEFVFNPVALRKAKIVCNFCLSECNRVKYGIWGLPRLDEIPQTSDLAAI